MNAVFFAALALTAGSDCGATPMQAVPVEATCGQQRCVPVATATCATCAATGERGGVVGCLRDWFGPMPQTCYTPRFGCYPGNGRHMHRYPAFHGYYYRKPYNYRMAFDYPWHAAPHEPQGYGSCGYGPVAGCSPGVPMEEVPLPARPIPAAAD
jgi:hypothetical protein